MKRIGLILAAVVYGSLTVQSQNLESKKSATSDSKVIVAKVHSVGLENNLLEDSPDRNVSIYLPPGYEDSLHHRYPVIYFLHGFTQDHDSWWGNLADIEQIMNTLLNLSQISPMIVVLPSSKNKYKGSWYTNSSVTGNWEDFIVEDVVQFVDSNFRTLPQVESRGIAGHSMGGYGTIKLAMRNPGTFGSAYALSPANMVLEDVVLGTMKSYLIQAVNSSDFNGLSWQAQATVAGAAAFAPNPSSLPYYGEFPVTTDGVVIDSIWQKWLEHDPFTMLTTYKDSLLKLRAIRFDCGTSDNYLYNSNVRFSQTLTDNGIEHVFEDFVGDHTNKLSERIRTKMLPFFSATLSKNMLSDTVTIPDTAFLHALIDVGVDVNGDSLISYAEAEAVTDLDVSANEISDMTGIEAFAHLDTLYCGVNQLTSLNVSNCTQLEFLSCAGNQIATLDLANNTALKVLKLGGTWGEGNLLTVLDVSNNTSLEHLICSNNPLSSLDVSGCTALEGLWCFYNQLTSLNVSGCTALSTLRCEDNQLASLDVSSCTALEDFSCDGNQLASLDVSSCTALTYLTCNGNQLTSLNICNNDSIIGLYIGSMPTLDTVYVWVTPFPPAGVNVYTYESPNVEFIVCSITGINAYSPTELLIYPNPVNDLLTVEVKLPDLHTIEITSLNGQLIYSDKIEGPTHQIDLSSFQKGLYLITIRSRDYVITEKTIKL